MLRMAKEGRCRHASGGTGCAAKSLVYTLAGWAGGRLESPFCSQLQAAVEREDDAPELAIPRHRGYHLPIKDDLHDSLK